MPSHTNSYADSNSSTYGFPAPDTNSLVFSDEDEDEYTTEQVYQPEVRESIQPLLTRLAFAPKPKPNHEHKLAIIRRPSRELKAKPPREPFFRGLFQRIRDPPEDPAWPSPPSECSSEPLSLSSELSETPLPTDPNSYQGKAKPLRKRDKVRALSDKLVGKIKRMRFRERTGQTGYATDIVDDPIDLSQPDGRSEGPRDTLRRMYRVGNPTDFVSESEGEEYTFIQSYPSS